MSNWILLPHLAGLRIAGPDSLAFSHAQFTSPFSEEMPAGWGLTAWCNPKGKVLATILARGNEHGVDLIVPRQQVESLARSLRLYAIGRKLEFGPDLTVSGSFTAPDPQSVMNVDSGRGLDLGRPGSGTNDEASAAWRVRDVCAGIAWLSPEHSGQFLPQALGLEERGGLSYRKGCYPGQEVIARVHFLGRAKQRLSGFRLRGRDRPEQATVATEQGDNCGVVLTSEAADEGRVGLAVVAAGLEDGQVVSCCQREMTLLPPSSLC
ncbi:MAG: folate-binding protein [Wenzhouxiangella sp.]|nr:MAG: folate-binding protein [Wenzhouxiangella sp.]